MSISYGAKGTNGNGTTSITPTYPAGITAGDLLLAIISVREWTNSYALIADPSWTGVGEMYGTTGAVNADTGPLRQYIFAKIADGTESGSLTISAPASTSAAGAVFRFSSTTGEFYLEWARGEDTSSGTGFSAACTPHTPHLGAGWIQPGDMLFAFACKPTDVGTWASQSISSSGLTIGSSIEVIDYTTSFGNDLAISAWYATVTSGTQSSDAVTVAATISASYGSALVLRIRDTAPTAENAGVPVVVGHSAVRNNGQTTVWCCPPIGAQDGDLIVAGMTRGNGANLSDATSKGWWVLDDTVFGARAGAVIARIYDSTDPATDYALTVPANAQTAVAVVAIRDHGVVADTDIQVGTGTSRSSSVTTVSALGVTTAVANMLALAFSFESSNTVGLWSQTTGDFDLLVEQREQGNASTLISFATILGKEMPSAGATGDVVLDYGAAASTTARGIQIAIPPAGGGPAPIIIGVWNGALEDVAAFKTLTSLGPVDVEMLGMIASTGFEPVEV